MKKRLGSLLMCLALLLALLPAAQAEENVALTVEIRGSGTVQMGDNEPADATDTKYFAPGTTVTLKAVPAEGYRMAFWFDGTASQWTGTAGSRELTVQVYGDTKCIAEFLPDTETYSAEWVTGEGIDMEPTPAAGAFLLDFGPASVGYGQQAWKTVRVRNTGSTYMKICDAKPFLFTVDGQDVGDRFECSLNSTATMLGPGGWTNIKIRPKTGLPAGVYTAEMALTEVCDPGIVPPLTASVTFRVTEDPVITLAASPAEGGTVRGGGIYKAGDTATLTAAPNPHFRFKQWSDGDTSNPRTLKVSEPLTLEAEFERTEAALTMEIRGNGAVQIGDYGTVTETTTLVVPAKKAITLKATPGQDSRMAYWFDGTASMWTGTPGSHELVVTLYTDTKCVAVFIENQTACGAEWVTGEGIDLEKDQNDYTLDFGTVSADYGQQDWKTVRVRNTGSVSMKINDGAPFLFTSAEGAEAADWFECSTYSNTMLYPNASAYLMIRPKTGLPAGTYTAEMTLQEVCDPGIDPPLTAGISFKVTKSCVISTPVEGSKGGTVTGAGTYEAGQTVTLTAKPDTNYAFDHWERGDGSTVTANPLTFRVEEAETVTAFFRRTGYTVSVAADPPGGGTVTLQYADGKAAQNGGSFAENTRLLAVAEAGPGYVFAGWTDNGLDLSSDTGKPGAVTVTANPDHALTARFVPIANTFGWISAPVGTRVILAEYDGGRMTGLRSVTLTADCAETDAMTLFRISRYPDHFKLILMSGTTFGPLCEAWDQN